MRAGVARPGLALRSGKGIHLRQQPTGKKTIRAADAKEVGVGNPAEETCRYPNRSDYTPALHPRQQKNAPHPLTTAARVPLPMQQAVRVSAQGEEIGSAISHRDAETQRFWLLASVRAAPLRLKPSSLLDTRVIYCGDNLEHLQKWPDACVVLTLANFPRTLSRCADRNRDERAILRQTRNTHR